MRWRPIDVHRTGECKSGATRRARLALAAALALALGGCLGMGGGGDTAQPVKLGGGGAPPRLPSAGSPSAESPSAASPSAAGAPQRPSSADIAPVAMLDVFRKVPFGRNLNKADDVYAERSAQLALEYANDGASRPWTNPENGSTGSITPTRTYQERDGTYCREFDQSIQVRERGNTEVKGSGEATAKVACRQASGLWKFLP